MKPLDCTITLDQPAQTTIERLGDVEHWENLASSMGFDVIRHGQTPPFTPGQRWTASGEAGNLRSEATVILEQLYGSEMRLSCKALDIVGDFVFSVLPEKNTSLVRITLKIKPGSLRARALLVPLEWRRRDMLHKIERLAARHLTVKPD